MSQQTAIDSMPMENECHCEKSQPARLIRGPGAGFFLKRPKMKATENQTRHETFLRVPKIIERMGVSRSYWWKGVKDGKFPPGTKLSARVTVWRESSIDALIATIGK